MSAAALRPALRKQAIVVSSHTSFFNVTCFIPLILSPCQPVASLARSLNTSATTNMANPTDATPTMKEPLYKTFEIYRWVRAFVYHYF
jgi:hypothetical protein